MVDPDSEARDLRVASESFMPAQTLSTVRLQAAIFRSAMTFKTKLFKLAKTAGFFAVVWTVVVHLAVYAGLYVTTRPVPTILTFGVETETLLQIIRWATLGAINGGVLGILQTCFHPESRLWLKMPALVVFGALTAIPSGVFADRVLGEHILSPRNAILCALTLGAISGLWRSFTMNPKMAASSQNEFRLQ